MDKLLKAQCEQVWALKTLGGYTQGGIHMLLWVLTPRACPAPQSEDQRKFPHAFSRERRKGNILKYTGASCSFEGGLPTRGNYFTRPNLRLGFYGHLICLGEGNTHFQLPFPFLSHFGIGGQSTDYSNIPAISDSISPYLVSSNFFAFVFCLFSLHCNFLLKGRYVVQGKSNCSK